jgi:hypothetical protein
MPRTARCASAGEEAATTIAASAASTNPAFVANEPLSTGTLTAAGR